MKLKIKIFIVLFITFIIGFTSVEAFSFRDMTLKFAQISDTHISDRDDTSYKLLSQSKILLKDAINQINSLENIDFVMFTGDMVDQPFLKSYKDFFEILSELKYPSLMALGNHDAALGTEG